MQRLAELPLILAGPIVRRVEPRSVTVWLALKEARLITLCVYARCEEGKLVQRFIGTHPTIRLGDHLHIVAVTAGAGDAAEPLAWSELYYYDLFFQTGESTHIPAPPVPESAPHLASVGILVSDPTQADPLQLLVYPGQPLPSFVLPAAEVDHLRIVHGSCRKPHGVGREMLSALDTLLATAAQQGEDRPQQLYLTGDQIYADDVASPLLFTLIDASSCLLTGNEEEVLPLLHTPAHVLAPGRRSDSVITQAKCTTTSPHNHLLSFAEYATMYLFAWSDVLWGESLPTSEELWQSYTDVRPTRADMEREQEQYAEQVERLSAFRDALPHVRRALANIATYMICDDHEITDDWFLDGAWCKQVLSNPLGKRIVRNGLLSYALFQAWGNTPAQFSAANGLALLDAVDTWRGDEQARQIQTISELIGLPAAFRGIGTLPYTERTLHWHYSYAGPCYQIIVLDTRTRRYYATPDAFPGLLSLHAMHTQLAASLRSEVDITIIISAAPVLGIDFVETVQFWSRWRIKDNYAFDREAWALEWGTFQRFLKTICVMKRVVFLSGDVHYAFGASMEYWDNHTKKTAKLVNYTSSALCNEGAGSQLAVLAIGYPRLLHLLRHGRRPALDFFVWDIVGKNRHTLNYVLTIIRKRLYRLWWAIPRLIAAHRSPSELVLPAWGWLKGAFDSLPPDRSYRLRYLYNTLDKGVGPQHRAQRRFFKWSLRPARLALSGVSFLQERVKSVRGKLVRQSEHVEHTPTLLRRPTNTLTREAIQGTELIERKLEKRRKGLLGLFFRYEGWLNRWKAGVLIVGYNNIGEISFDWNDRTKEVRQRLYWSRPDAPDTLLMTEYCEALDLPAPENEPPLP